MKSIPRSVKITLFIGIIILLPVFYSLGVKVYKLYLLQQFNIDKNQELYLMNGWFNFNNLSIEKNEIIKPTIDSWRFIASNRDVSKKGHLQAMVTADRKVLSYKDVLPEPALLVSDLKGKIIKTINLEFSDTEKNFPRYNLRFSPAGNKLALFSKRQIEIVDLTNNSISRIALDKEVQTACDIRDEYNPNCVNDFNYGGWDNFSDWLGENLIAFITYGNLFVIDVNSEQISHIENVDHLGRLRTIDEQTLVYTYLPKWDSLKTQIKIFDLEKLQSTKTFTVPSNWNIDFLETSPDGNYILLVSLNCSFLDIDCAGPSLLTARIMEVNRGKTIQLIKNHRYKQNSREEVYWIN